MGKVIKRWGPKHADRGRNPKAMQIAGTGGVGLRAARSAAAELLDRHRPDGLEPARQRMYELDNPTPGREYAELVAAGGRFVPAPGRLLCRQRQPYEIAKEAGLAIPESADLYRGQKTSSEYEVLAATPCAPPDDTVDNECGGGCQLTPGTMILANAHTGADVREWGGPDLYVLRCRRILAVIES